MTINNKTILHLVPMEFHRDKKNYIVENKLTNEFYEMPFVCIEAIHSIQSNLELGVVEELLQKQYPYEEIDIFDFASQLLHLKLIQKINDIEIQHPQIKNEERNFNWISPVVGKFFFNKTSNFVYIFLFLMNALLFFIHPQLFPHYKDLFIFDYMSLNIVAIFIISILAVLLHEGGHILAMRAYGLPTRMDIGHRLFFLVFETDLSQIWKLSSKDRNVLFFAGSAFDTVILFIMMNIQLIHPPLSPVYYGVFQIIIFNTVIRLLTQACIYMKTDLYYVFENVTGCYNLMENAGDLIRSHLPFFKAIAKETVYEGEKKVIFSYAIFYAIGVALTIFLYFVFYIPQMIYAFKKVLPGLFHRTNSSEFWDAWVFVTQIVVSFGLLFYSWSKKYRSLRYV